MESKSKRQQKKTKRNIIIAGMIMIFLMIFSMLGVYLNSQDAANTLKYNTFSFNIEQIQGGQMYTTKLNGQKYYFYTLPDAAITSIGNLTGIDRISAASTLIFTKDPLSINQQASSEQITFSGIAADLSATAGKTILVGITTEDSLSGQIVLNCNNANTSSPVLMLKEGTYSSINITEKKPNCFEISSNGMDLLVMRDYLLYKSLGIITN